MNQKILKNNNGLLAPQSYLDASKEEINKIFNGCGPDGIVEKIIPDNILGVDISRSCSIHDWMFHYSKTSKDLKIADEVFKLNMNNQIKRNSSFIKRLLVKVYYYAVRLYGVIKK